ncbi:hypothetical protein [Methylocystis sp. B8]|uniref:hypothetical protein n=1 Tax=Methylocystis sp. B8 TaxID=544938 RepID=UPI0010FE4904|nr:hypothetical protein [Methylocystis sp. B8]TLG78651.1 hypothetical protein FEV16_01010 [Methylocystis sp. B8]
MLDRIIFIMRRVPVAVETVAIARHPSPRLWTFVFSLFVYAVVSLGCRAFGLSTLASISVAVGITWACPIPSFQKIAAVFQCATDLAIDGREKIHNPPALAEFLVGLFAKPKYRTSFLQCLDEDFRSDINAGMPLSRARWRYRAAALNSVGPQLWVAIKRIGVIGIVADYVRRKFGGA